jgi:hypothetical protein
MQRNPQVSVENTHELAALPIGHRVKVRETSRASFRSTKNRSCEATIERDCAGTISMHFRDWHGAVLRIKVDLAAATAQLIPPAWDPDHAPEEMTRWCYENCYLLYVHRRIDTET